MKAVFIVALAVLLSSDAVWGQEEAEVAYATPKYGSINGGTQIKVFGNGFTNDLQLTASDPTREVFFVSSFTEYPCELHDAESDERQLVCYTRAMDQGVYYVRVKINGVSLDNSKYCNGGYTSWECSFRARDWRTPKLSDLDWVNNEPLSLITAVGRLYTNLIDAAVAAATNGNEVTITRVWLTSGKCNLRDENNDPYGVTLDGEEGESDWGTLICKIESSFVGNQNISFIVDSDYGRSQPYTTLSKVSADNRLYMLQTYAVVSDISPKEGSNEGGTSLTISGNYFDNLSGIDARVLVGGEECTVKSVSDTKITCTTSAKPASRTLYSGGRGMKIEVFPGINNISADVNSSFDGVWTFYSNSTASGSIFGTNLARAQGFFVPAYDANYYFAVKGDAEVKLSLSADNDPANIETVVSTLAANQYGWSGELALVGGNEYYFDILHVGDSNSSSFTLAVKIDRSDYTPSQTASALTDYQHIIVSSEVTQEVQTLSLNDWQTQASASSIWEIEVKNISCVAPCYDGFILTLFEISTVPILYGSDAYTVQTIVQSLSSLQGDIVAVAKNDEVYILTFTSERGSLPLSGSVSSSKISIDLTETTEGIASLNTFSLQLNGYVSTPILVANQASVEAAVKSLYGIQCPYQLEISLGITRFLYQDFEISGLQYGERTGEKAYCGIYSVKNPSYLFNVEEEIEYYQISRYKQLCFSYVGDITDRLRLKYTYKDQDSLDVTVERDYYTIGLSTTDEWTHFCIDIDDLLKTEYPDATQFYMGSIRVYEGTNTTTDLYLDNILIASSLSQSATAIEELQKLIRPSVVPHIQLEDVEVAVNNTEYTITFHPLECGHNFPLLEIGFALDSSTVGGEQVYSMSASSSIAVSRQSTASPPVTGSFAVSFEEGDFGSLSAVPADTEEEDMVLYLESIRGVGTVSVVRTGTCYGYTWRIGFVTPGGEYPNLITADVDLAGDSPAVTHLHTNLGGLFLEPIYGDFLRTAHDIPQVQVYINNILSHCTGDNDDDVATSCGFEWTDDSTPTVTDVDVDSGSAGDSITITGTGFSSNNLENVVTIGGVDCTVTSSSSTSMTVTVGDSPGGTQPLSVVVTEKGVATIPAELVDFSVLLQLIAVSPSSGSIAGCTSLTITGSGFSDSTTIMIDTTECAVTSVQYDSVTCVTSAHSVGSYDVKAIVTGTEYTAAGVVFEFTTVGTAEITDITPTTFTVSGGEELTITGNGFTASEGKVQIGGIDADVMSWSDTSIVAVSPGLSAGTHTGNVVVGTIGCARNSGALTYSFTVTSISPTSGSLIGGTTVSLTGTGFTNDAAIRFGEVECGDVVAASSESMTCITRASSTLHQVNNGGKHSVYGIGYGWSTPNIEIVIGDEVQFSWGSPLVGVDIGLYTVDGPTSRVYDEAGFQVPKTNQASFTFRFNNVGTFHYFSGCLDDEGICALSMRGSVTVTAAASMVENLSVKLSDSEDSTISREAELSSGFSFTFEDTATPTVTNVSPNFGTTDTTITITGTGFTAQPAVDFNGKSCAVQTHDSTTITCKVLVSEEMEIGKPAEIVVNVPNNGNARNEIPFYLGRSFWLQPLISSISPASGSIAGGTRVTVEGSGFTSSSSIQIGSTPCNVIVDETSYTMLVCVTIPAIVGVEDLVVTENGFPSQCLSACEFSYSVSSTPVVNALDVNPALPSETVELTFGGEGFGTIQTDVTVTIGTEECVLTSITDIEIVCSVGRFAVGGNDVKVHVAGMGFADFTDVAHSSIWNPAATDSITPESGSINGKTSVTLQGNGFVSSDLAVTIGGIAVDVTSSDFGQIIFETPAMAIGEYNVEVVSSQTIFPNISYSYSDVDTPKVDSVSPTQGKGGTEITLAGSVFGSTVADVNVEVGGVVCVVSAVTDAEIVCTLGDRKGGVVSITVHITGKGLATSALTFSYELAVDSISPSSGSYGGGQEVTITGQGFSQDSSVTICGETCTLKDGATATQVQCITPANSATGATTMCDVSVSNGNDAASLQSAYTYDNSLTPIIDSVSPSSGGTAGGTTVTIIGTGFGTSPTVSIDGSDCIIDEGETTETQIVCVTESHEGSINAKVSVQVGTNGIATQGNADFYYADKWSSVFTWGGTSVPTTQDFVIIPQGKSVLLDTETAVMKMLLIDGGELIFEDKDGVKLNAENILIINGGLLQVGTEESPIENNVVIEMYGNLRSPELPIYGAKTLGVRNGTLEMHGRHIPYTWTMLAATADVGATQITLQHSVNWRVGDKIAIASTGLRHSQSENEEREITAISTDGTTLTITPPLDYKHLGVTKTYGGDVNVQYRAEVGLLSRNIVVRGSDDHVWHDPIEKCEEGFETGQFATQTCFQGRFGEETGSDQFGASIMIHAKETGSGEAVAHIEYVEVTNAGQAFRLGRYPIHWHLQGDVSGMYVKGCSIHKTFNRAVTIHNTHNLLVDRNVVYDVMGGAIFIEDGIETGNIITHNLAIFVKQSTSLLNDDITPAAYWVTNPNNTLENNHAAGGTHFAFWYRMHENPDGPSFDPDVCQQKVQLGSFRNNTAHSLGWFGIWIFQTYHPSEGPSCNPTGPSPAKFYSLTTWNCEKGAEWVNVGAIQFIDFVVANNEVAGFDLKLISETPWGEEGGAMIKNAVIIGHSDTDIHESGYESDFGIILPFAGGLWTKKARFFNFQSGSAFGITAIAGTCTNLCGGFYYWTSELEFDDVARKVFWRWEHEGVIQDLDGSFLGNADATVVPTSGLVDTDRCIVQDGLEFSSGVVKSAICNPAVRFHRLAFNNVLPSSIGGNDVIISNRFGNSTGTFEKKRLTHKPGWMFLLTGKEDHLMAFKDAEQFTNISYNARVYDFQEDEYVIISHILTQSPDVITINEEQRFNISNATALTADSYNRDWYFNNDTSRLSYILSGKSDNRSRRAIEVVDPRFQHFSVQLGVHRCFYDDCLGPVDPVNIPPDENRPGSLFMWSNQSSSCIDRSDPANVVILATSDSGESCWVIVDEAEISVETLTIYGVLDFNTNTQVFANYILNLGGRIVAGFPNKPFTHTLTITLRGDHDTPARSLPGVSLGSKALGCFGGCDFHGVNTTVQWTHLSSTANVGATSIVLEDAVEWEVGNEIVITTTGYRAQETEKNVIAAISEDRMTIELETALQYRHMGEQYSIEDYTFPMRAEVGLLTKNIKIIGETYDSIISQAFGARVIVGYTTSSDNNDLYGWGRFSNVEFFQTGQEGWTDSYDPRFSLAWLDTGTVNENRPSYVAECAFHDGFSTAIGIFGANGISVTKNVVHRTIHDGIRITGSNHVLENNLVTVSLFRGTYNDRYESKNFMDWQANFEVSQATNLRMNGNTAAGCERICFHIDGEACGASDENAWTDNVAHGALHGVQIFVEDGVGTCSEIRNFIVYKAWDFGIYVQCSTSLIIKDTIIADSTVNYFSYIFAPSGLSHNFEDKFAKLTDVLIVGRSDHFDPAADFMDEVNDRNLLARRIGAGPTKKAPPNPTGGKTGILLPMFASGPNAAPFKSFHMNLNYPANHGLLDIQGLTLYNFGLNADNTRDLVFWTNPKNGDAHHPTHLTGTKLIQVEDDSKILLDRPSLQSINPSDCVDMECDAKKKSLVKDLDGSFLGEIGAVIPDASFGWDDPNEISRGLGDYRIPKTLLTAVDGTRVPVEDIIDTRGIIRNDASCTYVSAWQAFDCKGPDAYDYAMLVIESLDEDTETRRLSPVALLGDRCIDLNNGPQDHGWCFGYTCQKRISTFFTIVATGTEFKIFFTGYAPKDMRLHLLNVDETKAIRVGIYYARPERLDITRATSGLYIRPTNSYYDATQNEWLLHPPSESTVSYKPPIDDTGINGDNFMDRTSRIFYVTVKGSEPVDIKTSPLVIIGFSFPAVSTDEFFGPNIVSNLATFLGVPDYKIRIVDIVREDGARKRRSTTGRVARQTSETVTYVIEIAESIANGTGTVSNGEDSEVISFLNDKVGELVLLYQSGELWEVLSTEPGTEFYSMDATLINETIDPFLAVVVHKIPTQMQITSSLSNVVEQTTFGNSIAITLLDSNGESVTSLGGMWMVRASLDTSGANADNNAVLQGTTTVSFSNGVANFTDLLITHSGSGYNLMFEITQPTGVNVATNMLTVDVENRCVIAEITSGLGNYVTHGTDVDLTLTLKYSDGRPLDNIGFKGHAWKATVDFDDSTIYPSGDSNSEPQVSSATFNFDPSTGSFTSTGLRITNTLDYNRYNLVFNVYTEPALYAFSVYAYNIEYIPEGGMLQIENRNPKQIRIAVLNRPYTRASSNTYWTFETYVYNNLRTQIDHQVNIGQVSASDLTTGNSEISFTVYGANATVVESAVSQITNIFTGSTGLTFNGDELTAVDQTCPVNVDGSCDTVTVALPTSIISNPTNYWYIIGPIIGVAIVIAAFIVAISCVIKRAHRGKVGSSTESLRTPVDSFGSYPNSVTPSNGRMTPVQN